MREPDPAVPDTGTRLAYERTFLAHERTQMAWVRTGLGLISFGFAIAKFFQFLNAQRSEAAPVFGPFTVGMLMIIIALVGLAISNTQHRRAVTALRKECSHLPPSIAGAMAFLIMILGCVAFVGALVRH